MEKRGTPDESAPVKVPTFVLTPQPYMRVYGVRCRSESTWTEYTESTKAKIRRIPRLANARPRARDEDDAERARASVIRTLARLPARRVARGRDRRVDTASSASTSIHPRRRHVDGNVRDMPHDARGRRRRARDV